MFSKEDYDHCCITSEVSVECRHIRGAPSGFSMIIFFYSILYHIRIFLFISHGFLILNMHCVFMPYTIAFAFLGLMKK
jgi:hypothetical protein